jgi:hypothetical protein
MNDTVDTESEFWSEYYKRTGDYSVGYAATICSTPAVAKALERLTNITLEKHQLPNGKYWLPLFRRKHVKNDNIN